MTVNERFICDLINHARMKVVYVAPSVSKNIVDSIMQFTQINSTDTVEMIIDSDPNVCRFGYGDIDAVEMLFKNGIIIRKCKGIRIGIIICDDNAFIYSPTPLVIEDEPNINSPNAISVEYKQAKELVNNICINQNNFDANTTDEQLTLDYYSLDCYNKSPEIGNEVMSNKDLDIAKQDLSICPPQKFDISRRVMVYHSYIQFVELKLNGCNIERHTISIPVKLLNLVKNSKDKERLKASYRLLGENSKITGKKMDEKVSALRKKYIKSLGARYGNVILMQKKEEFLKEVDLLKKDLEKFKKQIEKKLETEFKNCRKELINILTPGIMKNPPDDLVGFIITKKPTTAQAKEYIEDELNSVMPDINTFINDMNLQCDFKDVTYEMLKDEQFFEALKKAYKYVNFPNLFEEYQAAKEIRDNNSI